MTKSRLPYLPALDGLRALAIIAVLLYHAEPAWLPGGFLGVDLFFVISAYLITALLVGEWNASELARRRARDTRHTHTGASGASADAYPAADLPRKAMRQRQTQGNMWEAHGAINLRAFWARRARRLLPVAFVLIGLTLVAAVVWQPDELAALRDMGLSAGGYVTNWYLIFSGQSYFESAGRPSLLRHLWSLAIEEQFYLVWPLLLWGLLRIRSNRVRVVIISAGVVASALWMAYLYQPGQDPSRVYYGTDTRAAELLVGAALALLWTPWRVPVPSSSSRRRVTLSPSKDTSPAPVAGKSPAGTFPATPRPRLLSAAGLLALMTLALICLRVNEADDRLYRGGLLAVALLSAVAIAAAVEAQGLFARVLAHNPLRWIGLRSYSLYLWHWPVFMLTRPQLDLALDGPPLLLLRLTLTLVLAELSYRLVEMPVRHGALGEVLRRLRRPHSRPVRPAAGAASLAALAALLLLGRAVALAQPPQAPGWLLASQSEGVVDGAGKLVPANNTRGRAAALSIPDAQITPPGVGDGASGSAAIPLRPVGTGSLATKTDDPGAGLHAEDPAAFVPLRSASETLDVQADPAASASRRSTGEALDVQGLAGTLLGAFVTTPAPGTLDGINTADHFRLAAGDATSRPGADFPDDALVPDGATPAPEGETPVILPVAPTPDPAQVIAPAQPPARPVPPAALPPVTALLAPEQAAEVWAIGDSVMFSAAREMWRVVGGIDIDAQLGRHTSTTIELLRARQAANQLGEVVIIQTGNNGYLSVREMHTMLELLSGVRRVVFINLRVPRAWEQNNNDILRGESEGRPHVVLVDWSAASANHPEYFWDDGMHLRPYGARVYATLIAAALAEP